MNTARNSCIPIKLSKSYSITKLNSLIKTSREKKYKTKNDKILKYMNSLNLNNNFDGLAIKKRKVTIYDKIINLTNKGRGGKNNIFDKPFPFLYTVSKRKVLNYSEKLLPGILTYYNNKVIKTEEYHKHQNFNLKEKKNHSVYMTNRVKKYRDSLGSKDYLKMHNINFYNRTIYLKDNLDTVENNNYKYSKYYEQKKFIEEIKKDVVKLKYNKEIINNKIFY